MIAVAPAGPTATWRTYPLRDGNARGAPAATGHTAQRQAWVDPIHHAPSGENAAGVRAGSTTRTRRRAARSQMCVAFPCTVNAWTPSAEIAHAVGPGDS